MECYYLIERARPTSYAFVRLCTWNTTFHPRQASRILLLDQFVVISTTLQSSCTPYSLRRESGLMGEEGFEVSVARISK